MAKTVLVTGASGFLASYVIEELLEAGWTVKGTVRSEKKGGAILERYPGKTQLSLVEVPDLVSGKGLKEALEGVDAIVHVASPYIIEIKEDPLKELITPAVTGTLSVLKAAKAAGIKRVVVTSSFAAVTNFEKGGAFREYTYTSEDWNPTTLEQALEKGKPGAFVYSASKKLAEAAAFEYGKQEDLEIVTMNPPMIYGPPLQEIESRADVNTSSNAIYALIDGPADREVPWNRLPLFCHVKDVALAHVRALEAPTEAVAGHRYILCGGAFLWEDAILHLKEARPALASRLPKLPAGEIERKPIATLDTTPAQKDLGIKSFREWKATLEETIDALVAKESLWQ